MINFAPKQRVNRGTRRTALSAAVVFGPTQRKTLCPRSLAPSTRTAMASRYEPLPVDDATQRAEEIVELQAQIAELQTESEDEDAPSLLSGGSSPPAPSHPPGAELVERTMIQEQIARLERQMAELTPRSSEQVVAHTPMAVYRDSMSDTSSLFAPPPATVEKQQQLEEALAENAKLRQVVSSAKAVDDDQERLRVLATVDVPDIIEATTSGLATGPPKAPADRTMRKTSAKVSMAGGLYFTPDAKTIVHGGNNATKLSMWDLCTGASTNGGGTQSAGTIVSAVSPDGQLLCIASKDGMAMYEFTQRSSSDGSGMFSQHVMLKPLQDTQGTESHLWPGDVVEFGGDCRAVPRDDARLQHPEVIYGLQAYLLIIILKVAKHVVVLI